jgi:hypothetical protein
MNKELTSTASDYTQLCDLLAAQKWKKADGETAKKMLEVMSRTEQGWLCEDDINNFPCEDLRKIDHLWVNYSNGRFGFSVQTSIYKKLGGTIGEYDWEIWKSFGDRVGWRKAGEWLSYSDLTFEKTAPFAHLPAAGWVVLPPPLPSLKVRGVSFVGWWPPLFSRIKACGL